MRKAIVLGSLGLLFACGGPPIRSKEDAATAAHRVGAAGKAADENKEGLRSADGLFEVTVTVTGKSGKAKVTFSSESVGLFEFSWTVEFIDNFSVNNEDFFNGKVVYTAKGSFDSGTASVSLSCKGKVNMSGEYSSNLDIDITMTASATVLKTTGEEGTTVDATLSVTYTGTVTADGTTYMYDEEPINIAATAATRRQTAGG